MSTPAYDPAVILALPGPVRAQVLGAFRVIIRAMDEGVTLAIEQDTGRLFIEVDSINPRSPSWLRGAGINEQLLVKALAYWDQTPPTPAEERDLRALILDPSPTGPGN